MIAQQKGGSAPATGSTHIAPDRKSVIDVMIAKQKGATQPAPAEHKTGLVQSLVQGAASPFLRTATNVLNFGESVADLAKGDVAGANAATSKARDFGYFGHNVTPVGMAPSTGNVVKDIGTGVKDILGTGGEIGSYLAPVGVGEEAVGAAKIAKQGLLPVLKKAGEGAAFGALGGTIGGAGYSAQQKDSNLGSIATGGLLGGATGGLLGGVLPIAGAAIGKTASEASRLLNKDQRVASTIAENERTLRQLEVNNATLRKNALANKAKGVDPVKLLSGTDLLKGVVDETGTIRTTGEGGPVSQLQDFIKPQEDIVSRALAQEGKTVPLADVRQQMINNINTSGIKGADKISALNSVENEIKGLQLEASPEGNIPLSAVHDAKRYKYANINYLNPSSKNTDKIIARTLKDIVERNTTSADIKALNNELGAHYSVLSLLEKLDGKKVQGGKLGRYFAKTIGGIAGSHFGPLGSIAGSEIAGKIQSALLKSNFGGETGKVLERSPLMENTLAKLSEAERQAKLPKLALPAPAIVPPLPRDTSGILSQAEAKSGLQARGWKGLDIKASEVPQKDGGFLSGVSAKPQTEGILSKQLADIRNKALSSSEELNQRLFAKAQAKQGIQESASRFGNSNAWEDVVRTIKASPAYKQEGSLTDGIINGTIMERPTFSQAGKQTGTRRIVVPREQAAKYAEQGYNQINTMDGLAHEAGMQSAEEYATLAMELSDKARAIDRTPDEKIIHDFLMQQEPQYAEIYNQREALKPAVKAENPGVPEIDQTVTGTPGPGTPTGTPTVK